MEPIKRAHSLIIAFTAAVLLAGCEDKGNDKPADVTEPHPCILNTTDEQPADDVTLPHKCYGISLYLKDENALRAIENGFIKNEISPNRAQSIRDSALLRTARLSPDIQTIELAVRFGANPDAKNIDGSGLVDIIIRSSPLSYNTLDKWNTLVFLHNVYGHDLGILAGDSGFFLSAAIETKPQHHENGLIPMLENMERLTGMSPDALQTHTAGINLLHIAAHAGSKDLLRFIHDKKLAPSPWDNRGYHALDYATPAFQRIMARDYGITRTPAPPLNAAIAAMSPGEYLRAFFAETTADYLAAPREEATHLIRPASDFSAYDEIRYDPDQIADNGINPALIIAEKTSSHESRALPHIEGTSRVAFAVSKALGSPDWQDITTISQNPQSHTLNHLTFALRNNRDDYVVVSNSVSHHTDSGAELEYQHRSSRSLAYIPALDQGNYIYYKSAGNSGTNACLSVDDVSFCMQSGSAQFHHINTVRIGAVRALDDGTHRAEPYSNRRPALCAPLPLDNGRQYLGTSFAAPAAAAVEERLADIFARSATLPDGVAHEDILMAMMLSAERSGLIDDSTNAPVASFQNSAGLTMDDRCGAGIIDVQGAADLLSRMIKWTRDLPGIEPTRGETVTLKLAAIRRQEQEDGSYAYNIRVPQDGILTQLRTGLPFEFGNRGAALIQIGDAARPFPVRPEYRLPLCRPRIPGGRHYKADYNKTAARSAL